MIKIHPLRTGSTIVDEALTLRDRSKNPLALTGIGRGEDKKIEVPVRAFLIEAPNGLILVDTGWDTAIRENAKKYEGRINYFVSPGFLPEGEAVTEQIAKLGYKPEDIDYVILTHMDIDHAGGLRLVKDAKKIMASESELKAAQKFNPRYLKRLWRDIPIKTFPDAEYDLLGDGSVILVPMHGHSKGMTGVKVKNEAGKYVILAGDAAYAPESWEKLVLPGITVNKKDELNSLKRLKEMSEDEDCAAILTAHDPGVLNAVIEL